MPAIRQKFIARADLRANPDALYLFGDNEKREGLGGQAREMRYEPNAVGIRVKRAPSNGRGDFWTDDHFEEYSVMIRTDLQPVFAHIAKSGIVVIPLDGIGTGLANLPTHAPRLFDLLQHELELIANFKITDDVERRRLAALIARHQPYRTESCSRRD